ncbi:MAG: GumC family protein [Pirellulaceae bacterium]
MRYSTYERPLTFFDILGSLFRYKWRVLLVSSLVFALGVVAIFLFPKKYESEAKLFVRLGRGSASLDPATVGQTISIQESRESEMNSIVDMLESRGLAESIVEEVGYERILQKYAPSEVFIEDFTEWTVSLVKDNVPALSDNPSKEGDLTSDEVKARKEYEEAVVELSSNLNIVSPKKSNTISVAYRGRTPELAFDVVNAVINNYQSMHIKAYQSGGAFDFFNEQFSEQERIVGAAEKKLREKKNSNAVVTLEGKQVSLQSEITEVKKMALQSRADLSAADAKVNELRAEMLKLPREMMSQKTLGIARNDTDAMRERLYQLEIDEKELSSKYVSSHPELVKVREQLRSARQIVGTQPKDREQSVVSVNPVRMDLEKEVYVAEADVARLSAKVEALSVLEAELLERLTKLNDLEVESFEMERTIQIARRNHDKYALKLEESRINAALDREAVSNVSVVGEPTLRYKHASPKRSVLFVLALLFSICCGLSVALASDYATNAREMRSIRLAERKRYIEDLEQDHDVRAIGAREKRQQYIGSNEAESSTADTIATDSPAVETRDLGIVDEEELASTIGKAK